MCVYEIWGSATKAWRQAGKVTPRDRLYTGEEMGHADGADHPLCASSGVVGGRLGWMHERTAHPWCNGKVYSSSQQNGRMGGGDFSRCPHSPHTYVTYGCSAKRPGVTDSRTESSGGEISWDYGTAQFAAKWERAESHRNKWRSAIDRIQLARQCQSSQGKGQAHRAVQSQSACVGGVIRMAERRSLPYVDHHIYILLITISRWVPQGDMVPAVAGPEDNDADCPMVAQVAPPSSDQSRASARGTRPPMRWPPMCLHVTLDTACPVGNVQLSHASCPAGLALHEVRPSASTACGTNPSCDPEHAIPPPSSCMGSPCWLRTMRLVTHHRAVSPTGRTRSRTGWPPRPVGWKGARGAAAAAIAAAGGGGGARTLR